MADVFPKFIIETDDDLGDCLILSKCTYHNELVTDKTKVKGGGWFAFKNNTFIFRGDSHEYGKAKFEDIKNCVDKGNVFTNPSLVWPIADAHNFAYDNGLEIITLKTHGEKL